MNLLSVRNAIPYLVLFALAAAVIACGGTSSTAPASAPLDGPATSVPEATSAPATEAPVSAPQGASPDNPAPRDGKVEAAGFEFSVVEVVRGEQALNMLKEASAFNKPHEDPAMEYVLVKVRAVYVGADSSEKHRIDAGFYSSMDSAGNRYEKPSILDVTNHEPFMQGEMLPGDVVEGWTTIQAPIDDPNIILVIWPRDNGMALGRDTIRYISLAQ